MGNYFSATRTKEDFTREKEMYNSTNSKQSEIQTNLKLGENLTSRGISLDTNSDVIGPRIYTNENGDLIFTVSSGNTLVIENKKQNQKNNLFTTENSLLCNSDGTSTLNGKFVNDSTNINGTSNVVGKLVINGNTCTNNIN